MQMYIDLDLFSSCDGKLIYLHNLYTCTSCPPNCSCTNIFYRIPSCCNSSYTPTPGMYMNPLEPVSHIQNIVRDCVVNYCR